MSDKLTVDQLPLDVQGYASWVAADWHGGQMTALYALGSSGSLELYPGEGIARICREIENALPLAAEANAALDYVRLSDLLDAIREL